MEIYINTTSSFKKFTNNGYSWNIHRQTIFLISHGNANIASKNESN